MIVSFDDDATSDLFHGRITHRVRRFPTALKQLALRKLDMLNAAEHLRDLREPPGNRLELLKGELAGFHGILVNEQWRVIFRWKDNGCA